MGDMFEGICAGERGVEQAVADVLAAHEYRWTTHGDVRLYDVIHCPGDCGWSLRQKALMSDDHVIEQHRQHVASVLADLIARERAAAAAEALREAALEGAGEVYVAGLRCDAVAVDWLHQRADRIEAAR